jgi:competence protein ComEC
MGFFFFLLAGISLLFLFPRRLVRFLALVTFLFFAGWFWHTQSLWPSSVPTIADRAGETLLVEGVVDEPIDHRTDKQLAILREVSAGGSFMGGRILVSFPLYPKISFGERIAFACTIQEPEPFGGFAYDRYLESRGVQAVCYNPEYVTVLSVPSADFRSVLFHLKERLGERLHALWPAPHADFLEGLLFGGSSSLSENLRKDFSASGLAHVLAASGFNVSLFTSVLLSWLWQTPLGRRRSLCAVTGFLIVYVVMAGATAAVVRAALMAGLLLGGEWMRRKAYVPNVLLGTLALMLAWNPLWLWFDVGFQLSFVAIIALLVLAPRWKEVMTFLPDRFGLRTSFASSLAATVLTAPILLWHFGSLSLIAPIANLFILPWIPFLMALSLLALGVSFLWLPLGLVVALPSWALCEFLLHMVVWFGSLPVLALPSDWAKGCAITLGLVEAGWLFFLHRRRFL